jgi:hypothetical protein
MVRHRRSKPGEFEKTKRYNCLDKQTSVNLHAWTENVTNQTTYCVNATHGEGYGGGSKAYAHRLQFSIERTVEF